jgi:hypothetical protein
MPMPWDEPGWFWRRLKEAIYQGLSWPYFVAIAFTVSALQTRDPTLITASIGMWSVALGRRLIQQGLEVRAGNGVAVGPPAYITAPATDDPTR